MSTAKVPGSERAEAQDCAWQVEVQEEAEWLELGEEEQRCGQGPAVSFCRAE